MEWLPLLQYHTYLKQGGADLREHLIFPYMASLQGKDEGQLTTRLALSHDSSELDAVGDAKRDHSGLDSEESQNLGAGGHDLIYLEV